MSDCVVDASAVVSSLARDERARLLRHRLAPMICDAPHLIDAEIGSALRRHERAGLLAPEEALVALRAARHLVDRRHHHTGALIELAWALRQNLTFYDALYVALAARLGVPLLTSDARLTAAPALPCAVELV